VLYVNFKCASYPEDWPSSAIGGYDGNYRYLANESTVDREVKEWSDLVRCGLSALCTQAYAHIIRRQLWLDFWVGRKLDKEYSSGETTYPHTWMIAETRFAHPSFYVGEPMVTIFNGAQSWGDVDTRARVSLRGLPELIALFARKGLSHGRLAEARGFAGFFAYETSKALFTLKLQSQLGPLTLLGANGMLRHRYVLPYIWRGYIDARSTAIARTIAGIEHLLGRG
jgi:hypothetical protein